MTVCVNIQNASPENAECSWCVRYRVNLDRNGRLCGRCKSDTAFRSALERQRVLRFGACAPEGESGARAVSAERPETTFYCAVFGVATDEAQCEKCRKDGEFRAFLHGQWLARRATEQGGIYRSDRRADERARRGETCERHGALLRHDVRKCCGGKERRVAVYACAEFGETHEGRCAECVGWKMKSQG